MPYVSVGLFVVGGACIWLGYPKLRARQMLLDQGLSLSVKLDEQKLRPASQERVENKIKEEVARSGEPIAGVEEYLRVERSLIAKVRECLWGKYTALPHMRAGNVSIDLVLQQAARDPVDLVCEIKFQSRDLSHGCATDVMFQAVHNAGIYTAVTGRPSLPVVMCVTPQAVLERTSESECIASAESLAAELRSEIRLVFVAQEELGGASCEWLLSKLGLPLGRDADV